MTAWSSLRRRRFAVVRLFEIAFGITTWSCAMFACGRFGFDTAPQVRDGPADSGRGDDGTMLDNRLPPPDIPPRPDAFACQPRMPVYLNFEGQTLTQGAPDATANTAPWLAQSSVTVPAFAAGAPDRAQQIATLTAAFVETLAPSGVQIVTTRPAAPPYAMLIIGGALGTFGGASSGGFGIFDCMQQATHDIGWIADGQPPQYTANLGAGILGMGVGLTGTTDPQDCMCGWGPPCALTLSRCSFGTAVGRDTATCPALPATQNELATLRATYCQ